MIGLLHAVEMLDTLDAPEAAPRSISVDASLASFVSVGILPGAKFPTLTPTKEMELVGLADLPAPLGVAHPDNVIKHARNKLL